MFSRRSSRDQSLNALAAALAAGAAPRFDLTGSNPTRAGLAYPPELEQALLQGVSEARVYQAEPFGLQEARTALGRVTAALPRDVMLTASTSEAYAFLFKLLCDAGDAVLVPAPSYPLFEHLAGLEQVQALPYRLAYDGAWHIDLDSLRRAVTPRARAVIVVSPNNPTGQYVSSSEQAAIAALGLPLISDEVFAEFPLLGSARPTPPSPELLSFRLDGLSKRAGSPQLKLAWTVIGGPEPLRARARERLELIADTFLSVGTPIQKALPRLLELAPSLTQLVVARCRETLAVLEQAVAGSSVTLLRAEAGWTAVLRLPAVASEEQLVLGLLREASVLVQPGWFYDFESEPYVVVSLLTEPSLCREGITRLVEHVSALA